MFSRIFMVTYVRYFWQRFFRGKKLCVCVRAPVCVCIHRLFFNRSCVPNSVTGITTIILLWIITMHYANRNIMQTSQTHTDHKLHSWSVPDSIFKQAICFMWWALCWKHIQINVLLLKQAWNFSKQVKLTCLSLASCRGNVKYSAMQK